jgi:hypothetical protein
MSRRRWGEKIGEMPAGREGVKEGFREGDGDGGGEAGRGVKGGSGGAGVWPELGKEWCLSAAGAGEGCKCKTGRHRFDFFNGTPMLW